MPPRATCQNGCAHQDSARLFGSVGDSQHEKNRQSLALEKGAVFPR
jgi:hypothetical protein